MHAEWKILKDFTCDHKDLKKYGRHVLKYGVKTIEECISYCKIKPDCDAVILIPHHSNCCYCKLKTCHNAFRKVDDTTKQMYSAYKE